ncbi:hypothetical protein CF319_g5229 [Tilletia indica]|nr:hypothetical protein CF319_g5229 [Tilletia indica]
MIWGNFAALLLIAISASLVEAGPSTSTSCYTVRVSGTQTRTSSLAAQTRRPAITTCPVVKSTITVTRPRTSTSIVATISTTRVTEDVPPVTQTVTPTIFTVTVPVITVQAPAFTPTQTDFVIETVPGTFTTTSTTFTNPPGPTLPAALPRGTAGDDAEEEDDLLERSEDDGVLDRRAGKRITPDTCDSESQRMRGKRVYCRRVVRFAPTTVAGTRTRTVTVRTTTYPLRTATSTVTAVYTSTVFKSGAAVSITAAPTTSTIVASPITTTSTSTAATVTIKSTILTPQPTLVVSRVRSIFCGPRSRFYRTRFITALESSNQQINFIGLGPGQDCCDAASDIPGAIGFAEFDCAVVQIAATPLENFCVAGNPATVMERDLDGTCDETCISAGLLQCGS